jgi:hypothetical protein
MTGDSSQQVALAEDSEQSAAFSDDQQCADISLEHEAHRFAHSRFRRNRHRLTRLEHADRIFHETAFDPITRRRPIELRQIMQAIAAILSSGEIIVAAGRADHGSSR